MEKLSNAMLSSITTASSTSDTPIVALCGWCAANKSPPAGFAPVAATPRIGRVSCSVDAPWSAPSVSESSVTSNDPVDMSRPASLRTLTVAPLTVPPPTVSP
eukprot:CAMPEP_0175998178 /NCGR_PEP_ID=MMETSP0108-20121206/56589_1 /TAXON_ID=195067 ORGANISM="Goniomonas pacifica, Strain CCMP1869" /NCGR_SAMPLE_ID=MMETSP0108 /ASSEMBLY_ACC=CAM_ASM_000204 /LENGTH=101 /DNA_ID=CAMNT_0017330475 /DNA_START=164 /DNA_END=466 /DNA_ORIENTATION=+